MSTPPPDPAAAGAVLAELSADRPTPPDPVTAHAPGVLRPVPSQLSAKLARRVSAGLSPTGDDLPRRALARAVRPSLGLAILDVAGLGVCLSQGRTALAVIAAALFLLSAGLAGSGAAAARRDPLLVTARERAELAAAATWQAPPAPTRGGAAHRLVALGAGAAERVAASPAWLATRIDLLPVDLAAALDEVVRASGAASGQASTAHDLPEQAVQLVALLLAFADAVESAPGGAQAPDDTSRARLETLARQIGERTGSRFDEPFGPDVANSRADYLRNRSRKDEP